MKDRSAVRAAQHRCETSHVQPGQTWLHEVTQSVYTIVCLSVDEVRLVPLVTYRSVSLDHVWTRDLDVFLGPNEHGVPRFRQLDLQATHYAGHRCKACGSSDLQPFPGPPHDESWKHSCRTCGADPA